MVEQPNFFSEEELACRHCGEHGVQPDALLRLNMLRLLVGHPLPLNSGYRCKEHPIEKKKKSPGHHEKGWAFDLAVYGEVRAKVLMYAGALGFTSFGIEGDFLHIDCRPEPMSWMY